MCCKHGLEILGIHTQSASQSWIESGKHEEQQLDSTLILNDSGNYLGFLFSTGNQVFNLMFHPKNAASHSKTLF